METERAKVYDAIVAITGALAKSGISKVRKNAQQNYSFRGIDDVYNALAALLAEHRLAILPRVEHRDVVERTTKSGGVLFYVTVKMEFDFVSADDASVHTVTMFGEAMDSADKATNKAMSAAYKYACLQAFCIPTEGDNDADAQTHEIAPAQPTPVFKTSEDRSSWLKAAVDEIARLRSYEELMTWMGTNTSKLSALGANQTKAMNEKLADAKARLTQSPAGAA